MVEIVLFLIRELTTRGTSWVSSHFVLQLTVHILGHSLGGGCALMGSAALRGTELLGAHLPWLATLLRWSASLANGCAAFFVGAGLFLGGVLSLAEYIPPLYQFLLRF